MRIIHKLLALPAICAALPTLLTGQVKATDDYVHASVNAPALTIQVLSNDSSANGILKLDQLPLVNHGKASINADSTAVIFTPEPDYKGVALVNYTMTDKANRYDCGLVIIDLAETPTPTSQTMNLFTRKGQIVKFTVPKGFSITNPDTPDGKTTKKSDGVFEYAPKPNMTGTVELLFNKLEDGVSKEFHVNIEVLNAVTPSDYLVDDYVTVPVGISRVIQTLANDKPYRYAVRNVEYDISGGGDFNLAQQGDPREGRVMFSAFGRFNGSVSFSYIVTYVNGDKDTAVVHVVVSNFEPAQDEFQITAVKGLTQVLKYSVPEDFKQQGFYDFQFNRQSFLRTLNGGEIRFDNVSGNLIYVAPSNSDYDEFTCDYRVGGSIVKKGVRVKINLLDNNGQACTGDSCVWPGDANRDGKVDIWDIFPIGSNIGQYGYKRASSNLEWYPYAATNWSQTPDNNINVKNADLNGDGFVNAADTSVLLQNYGKTNSIFPDKTAEETQVAVQLLTNVTSVRPGDMIEILVLMGSSENPAIETRGLSFAATYEADKVKENSLTVEFSKYNFLSRYDAFLALSKIPVRGRVEAGIVRSRDKGASGHGEIGKIRAIVIDDIHGFSIGDKPTMRFSLANATMMDKYGHLFKMKTKDLVIPIDIAKTDEPLKQTDLVMFPNPTSDFASFYLNGANKIDFIRIIDMTGREVNRQSDINAKQANINFDNLKSGVYIAEVMTEKGRIIKKLEVIK